MPIDLKNIHPKRIILDTDLDTDCDDAGAVAVLHHLADEGRAEILAIVCDAPAPFAGACAAAYNAHYGRPDIPVAQVGLNGAPSLADYRAHRARIRPPRLYGDILGAQFLSKREFHPESPVHLYRRVLADAEDGSVTICAIGLLSALAELLASPPDSVSSLDGRSLVARKVHSLVCMAFAELPQGFDRFNWRMDARSTEQVLIHWPTVIQVQQHGDAVPSGAALGTLPERDPLRVAYDAFHGGPEKDRPSSDQLTVLWAVLGEASGLVVDFSGDLIYSAMTGEHRWLPSRGNVPLREHLGLRESPAALRDRVESYMLGGQCAR